MEKVSIKATTRGKGSKDFTYMGVGKLTERRRKDVDGNDLVADKDGNLIKYISMGEKIEGKDRTRTLIEGLGITKDKDGNYILADGLTFLTVHDVDVHGLLKGDKDGVNQALALLGEYPGKDETDTPAQRLVDAALLYYNDMAREAVSPKAEEKPDELGGLVAELTAAGLFKTPVEAATWRRVVTGSAKANEEPVLETAERTKLVKSLRAMKAA